MLCIHFHLFNFHVIVSFPFFFCNAFLNSGNCDWRKHFVNFNILKFIDTYCMTGLPWWVSYGKESACSVGDLGSTPGLRRSPGGGHGNPLQYSFPENSHGQRSLAGYSPWGHKELDMTEWLSTFYDLIYGISWRMLYVHSGRMCILLDFF